MNLKAGIRVAVVLAIATFGAISIPGTALALPPAGSISGTVTAASGGAPLKGVEVCAYEVEEEVEVSCAFTTLPSGEYTIAGLAPAEYKVEFWPHGEGLNYVTQYYNGKSSYATAEAVTVSAGFVTPGVSAQLQKGGSIAGTLTDASTHAPLAGIVVCALEPALEETVCASSGVSGQYTISGLPSSSSYRVVFSPELEAGKLPAYVTQYYSGKLTFAQANLVAVTVPAITSGIDAALSARSAPQVPIISPPPVLAPVMPLVPVKKHKTVICKKGFKKKTVRGKAKCVKKAKRHHRRASGQHKS